MCDGNAPAPVSPLTLEEEENRSVRQLVLALEQEYGKDALIVAVIMITELRKLVPHGMYHGRKPI